MRARWLAVACALWAVPVAAQPLPELPALPPSIGARFRTVHAAVGDLPTRHRALARRDGAVIVVEGTLAELREIAADPRTDALELSAPLRLLLARALPLVDLAPSRAQRGPGGGAGVIIGVVDTGIDWSHGDFADEDGATRVTWLMDVALPPRDAHPDLAQFGAAIWDNAELQAAIATPDLIESIDTVGHGTHVAGIATARGADTSLGADGVAPDATIIAVRATRDDGFYLDDTDVLNGVDFVLDRANQAGMPAVINISLGGHAGAHDGSSLFEQALADRFSHRPGRVLIAAIGNDGDRDIHVSGPLDDAVEVPIRVTSNDTSRGSGAAVIEFWYTFVDRPLVGPESATTVWLETPDGRRTPPAALGQSVREISAPLGIVAVTHARGSEGLGQIVVYLQEPADGPLLPGDYTVHVDGGQGHFDGWISTPGPFRARFTRHLDVDVRLGVPATAHGAVAVGAFSTRDAWDSRSGPMVMESVLRGPAVFTATGPTRDGRPRPDVLAPGVLVASTMSRHADPRRNDASVYAATVARGADPVLEDEAHAVASGTSMAAPFVTGAAALLLERDPTLTSEQVGGLLRATAVPQSDGWDGRRGSGHLDVARALDALAPRAAAPIDLDATRVAVTRDVLGPGVQAYVIVTPVGTDGLPYIGPWAAQIEVRAATGSPTVGAAIRIDDHTLLVPVTAGTAAGSGRVQATVNGASVSETATLWFGLRTEPGLRDPVVAGTGCAVPLHRALRWPAWRRR